LSHWQQGKAKGDMKGLAGAWIKAFKGIAAKTVPLRRLIWRTVPPPLSAPRSGPALQSFTSGRRSLRGVTSITQRESSCITIISYG
jgi:hypothetical protein